MHFFFFFSPSQSPNYVLGWSKELRNETLFTTTESFLKIDVYPTPTESEFLEIDPGHLYFKKAAHTILIQLFTRLPFRILCIKKNKQKGLET